MEENKKMDRPLSSAESKEAILKEAWDNHFGSPPFHKCHLKINYSNVVYAAMESYSDILIKERDEEIQRLKGLLEHNFEKVWKAARETVLLHNYNGSERPAAYFDKYIELKDFINNTPRQPN